MACLAVTGVASLLLILAFVPWSTPLWEWFERVGVIDEPDALDPYGGALFFFALLWLVPISAVIGGALLWLRAHRRRTS